MATYSMDLNQITPLGGAVFMALAGPAEKPVDASYSVTCVGERFFRVLALDQAGLPGARR